MPGPQWAPRNNFKNPLKLPLTGSLPPGESQGLGVPTMTPSPCWKFLSQSKTGLGVFKQEKRELTPGVPDTGKTLKALGLGLPTKDISIVSKTSGVPLPLPNCPSGLRGVWPCDC